MLYIDVKNNVYEKISNNLIRCLNTDKVFYGEIFGNILRDLSTDKIYPIMQYNEAEYPSIIDVTVSGIGALVIDNAVGLNYINAYGGIRQEGTPTPSIPADLICNNGKLIYEGGEIKTEGTQEVIIVTDEAGNEQTANCEMLLRVGSIEDKQNITTGKITRKCGVILYDGTQDIHTNYISTTGGLDVGAIVVYVLDEPIIENVEAQSIVFENNQSYTVDKFQSVYDLNLEVNYRKATNDL